MPEPILDEVRKMIRWAGLSRDDRLVVGLSGGVDSQVLTHVLVRLMRLGSGPWVLPVHVNHRLRSEADEDARQVIAIAEAIGPPCDDVVVDVAGWDRLLRQGTEAAARAARYAALARAALAHRTSWVAVGHTLDDQAETVLLGLLRGASTNALGGMSGCVQRSVRLDPEHEATADISIVRPLLTVRRRDIEDYATRHGLVPLVDPSNTSLAFRRNLIRHRVMPALEAADSHAVESIGRMAALLRDDADYIEQAVAEARSILVSTDDQHGLVFIERDGLRGLHPALRRRVVLQAVGQLVQRAARISLQQVTALSESGIADGVGATIELGAGIAGYVDYTRIAIGSADSLSERLRRAANLPLLPPGQTVSLNERGCREIMAGKSFRVSIETDRVLNARLRTRTPGDRFASGAGSAVRLQDWLVDRKVPSYVRDRLPLLEIDGLIHWVGGVSPPIYRSSGGGLTLRLLELECGNAGGC